MSIENPTNRGTDGSLLSESGSGCEPFKQTPNPRFLYTSPQQLNTYSLLFSSIHDRKGLILLTGEPGIGKTLLLRRMVADLEDSGCTVFYFCNPPSSNDALWRTCCEQVGVKLDERDAASYRSALIRFIENNTNVTALLMDEADGLPQEVLGDIAEMSSRVKNGAKLLQTILASQPRFASTISDMRLSDACTLHAELDPLPEREVAPFIRHQLLAAGWVEEWFSKEAIARIACHARGRPARINSLCREAMFIAQLESVPSISRHMIDLVARDQGLDKLIVKDTSVGGANSEDATLDVDRSVSSGSQWATTEEQSYPRVSRAIGDAGPPTHGAESKSEYPNRITVAPEFLEEDDPYPTIDQHASKDAMESPSPVPESEADIDPRSFILDGGGVRPRRRMRRGWSRASWFLASFLLFAGVIFLALHSGAVAPVQSAWEYLSRTVPQINAFLSPAPDGSGDAAISGLDKGDSTASTGRTLSVGGTETALVTHDESDIGSPWGTLVDPISNEAAPIPNEQVDVTASGLSSAVMDGLSDQVVEGEAVESVVAGKSDALQEDIPYNSPALHTRDATGAEDTVIALDIRVTSGTDEQVLLVEIEGLPDGAAFSSGAEVDGVWVLSLNDLSGLTVTPRENSDDDFTLLARLVDSDREQLAQETFDVMVHAVADEPRLDARAAAGDQYTAIPIEISTRVTDNDGSETLEIKISGVPSSAELSAGRNYGNGIWSLSTRDLRGLILTPLENSPPEIKLTVTAIATESSNHESSKTRRVLRFDVILSESSTS